MLQVSTKYVFSHISWRLFNFGNSFQTHVIWLLHPDSGVAGRLCYQMCVSVSLSIGGPMWPLPMIICTSLYKSPPQIWDPLTPSDIWWPLLETCSNLFTWGPSPLGLTSDGHWSIAKWVVHILLECFLVLFTKIRYYFTVAENTKRWLITDIFEKQSCSTRQSLKNSQHVDSSKECRSILVLRHSLTQVWYCDVKFTTHAHIY